jgi:hypothetical protein
MPYTADPTQALCALLAAELGLVPGNAWLEAAKKEGVPIFHGELPDAAQKYIRFDALLVMQRGGASMFGREWYPIIDTMCEVQAYGTTRYRAQQLCREACAVLHDYPGGLVEGTRILWCRLHALAVVHVDHQTNWPFATALVSVAHSVEATTPQKAPAPIEAPRGDLLDLAR